MRVWRLGMLANGTKLWAVDVQISDLWHHLVGLLSRKSCVPRLFRSAPEYLTGVHAHIICRKIYVKKCLIIITHFTCRLLIKSTLVLYIETLFLV